MPTIAIIGSALGAIAVLIYFSLLLKRQVDQRATAYHKAINKLAREVEERNAAEQILNQVQAIAHLGSWQWYFAENYGLWSDETYRIFGRPPEKEKLGFSTFIDTVHRDDRAKVETAFADALAGKEAYNIKFRIKRPSGEERVLWSQGSITYDEKAQPVQMVGFALDITDREKNDQERESLIRELESKNAELEQFVYTVSHDLKTPLVTIDGYLGYIESHIKKGDFESATSDLKRVSKASSHMELLLKQLLQLSRIGRIINPSEYIDISKLIDEKLSSILVKHREDVIEVNFPDKLPMVYGDKIRLGQAIDNLLENAIKYAKIDRPVVIEIGARREDDYFLFSIKDNGPGIEPEYHEKIFGLFERLDQSIDGAGVGLAITKRIIESHGGRIWIVSDGNGNGSIFYFTLPATNSQRGNTDEQG